MKVRELIEKLSAMNPDATVILPSGNFELRNSTVELHGAYEKKKKKTQAAYKMRDLLMHLTANRTTQKYGLLMVETNQLSFCTNSVQ